ncbi:hypothetical protein OIU74_005570 [Salix koriyanagi]|uniref:Uncharacterized protein n=1 Tax=Salix koriyanagi TaxID=2511006 RepID=A0A9Q0UPS3_9ROSI|nr:hypothetical protein OIU74_005570 [Salix koriyanagi]
MQKMESAITLELSRIWNWLYSPFISSITKAVAVFLQASYDSIYMHGLLIMLVLNFEVLCSYGYYMSFTWNGCTFIQLPLFVRGSRCLLVYKLPVCYFTVFHSCLMSVSLFVILCA